MKVKYVAITVDYELIASATGLPFSGSSARGDYEGVLRLETTIPISLYTNTRYIPNIVRRYIEQNTVRWALKGQEVVDDELGAGIYEVGNRIREGFFLTGKRADVAYGLPQEKYIVHIETAWKTTATTDYGKKTQRRRRNL